MGTTLAHPWPTYAWPSDAEKALVALQQGQGAVIYREFPAGTPRGEARSTIRLALRQALALWLGCTADRVALSTETGAALRIQYPKTTTQVSLSHEDGLSVAAIHPHRAIGVDVLATTNPPWADECLTLARDYLGPSQAKILATLPVAKRAAAFAAAWTRWEAGLKSCGQGLSEWTSAPQSNMDHGNSVQLTLPNGFCGAVALHQCSTKISEGSM